MKWRLVSLLKSAELKRKQTQELELHKKNMLDKHETMKDDIYRKRFNYSAQEERKLPTWALVLIYCVAIAIYTLIFRQ